MKGERKKYDILNQNSAQFYDQYSHKVSDFWSFFNKTDSSPIQPHHDQLQKNSQQHTQGKLEEANLFSEQLERIAPQQNMSIKSPEANRSYKKSKQIHHDHTTTGKRKKARATDVEKIQEPQRKPIKPHAGQKKVEGTKRRNPYNHIGQATMRSYTSPQNRQTVLSMFRKLGMHESEYSAAINYIKNVEKLNISLGYFYQLINYKTGTPQQRINKAAFFNYFLWFVSKNYLLEFTMMAKQMAKAQKRHWQDKDKDSYLATIKLLINLPDLTPDGEKNLQIRVERLEEETKRQSRYSQTPSSQKYERSPAESELDFIESYLV